MSNDLILWGRGSSSNVQKVIFLCAELGLEPKCEIVGGPFGGNNTNEFKAMNPNGTVPVLQDGALTLWESHAILRYLVTEKGDATLYPAAPADRAPIDQWMDWTANNFWPPIRDMFLGYFIKSGVDRQDPTILAACERFAPGAKIAAEHLASQPYMAGDNFSIADIPLAIYLNRFLGMEMGVEIPDDLARWFETVSKREAFAIATQDEKLTKA